MDRAEAAGLGMATAGHLALLAALSLGFAAVRMPVPKTDPIEVSFVEDVAPESQAPSPSAAPPAPKLAETEAPPEPAAALAPPPPQPAPQSAPAP
ncbi:MAG: cell envelope biogenesis protein TolA, partial [Alphaproteobacteria bacterium]|nr:cell envelope biogenesis protein TolA [Alphaproteobacteria bacterium]